MGGGGKQEKSEVAEERKEGEVITVVSSGQRPRLKLFCRLPLCEGQVTSKRVSDDPQLTRTLKCTQDLETGCKAQAMAREEGTLPKLSHKVTLAYFPLTVVFHALCAAVTEYLRLDWVIY